MAAKFSRRVPLTRNGEMCLLDKDEEPRKTRKTRKYGTKESSADFTDSHRFTASVRNESVSICVICGCHSICFKEVLIPAGLNCRKKLSVGVDSLRLSAMMNPRLRQDDFCHCPSLCPKNCGTTEMVSAVVCRFVLWQIWLESPEKVGGTACVADLKRNSINFRICKTISASKLFV